MTPFDEHSLPAAPKKLTESGFIGTCSFTIYVIIERWGFWTSKCLQYFECLQYFKCLKYSKYSKYSRHSTSSK